MSGLISTSANSIVRAAPFGSSLDEQPMTSAKMRNASTRDCIPSCHDFTLSVSLPMKVF
jgi:hypothetical protein